MTDMDKFMINMEGWRAKIKEEVKAELKDEIRRECEAELKQELEEQLRFQITAEIRDNSRRQERKRNEFAERIVGMSVEYAKSVAAEQGFFIDVRWIDGKSTGGGPDAYDTGTINVYILNGIVQSGKLPQEYRSPSGETIIVKEPWWG